MILRVLPALVLTALAASAADWPQWRGPDRTGHVPPGQAVPEKLAPEPTVVWRAPIGEGFASPVVSGGRVFYLDNKDAQEVAHAADSATGKELWQATIFSSHKDGFGIGPRCTPVADGDRVFVQSAKGELQCLNAADGKVIWRKNFVDDFGAIYIGEKGKAAGASRHGATGSPIIDGENLIAQVGSAQGASLVAFKKATGEVVWKSGNDQTAYAAPIIAEIAGVRQVISFTADGLIGLQTTDGKSLWYVPLKTALGRHVTTPNVWRDLVVVASHQVGLVATKVTATNVWRAAEVLKGKIDELASKPDRTEAEAARLEDLKDYLANTTGVDVDPKLAAIDAWINKTMAINFSSPVVIGDHLYGLGPAKNLVCIDLATGQLAWDKPGLTPTSADKAEAAFLVMGKNILVLNDAGELILFAADPAGYRELGRTQACGTNWCNPAYADGRLYLRDARELICLDLLK